MDQLLRSKRSATSATSGVSILEAHRRSWVIEKKLGRGFWVFFAVAFFFDFGFAVYFFLFNLFLVDSPLQRADHRAGGRGTDAGVGRRNAARRLAGAPRSGCVRSCDVLLDCCADMGVARALREVEGSADRPGVSCRAGHVHLGSLLSAGGGEANH